MTPRRELRALALPSEIMRLENLSGYLKFPGPFPVASIRLNYVARPKAAERFVPREGDGTEPAGRPDGTANPPETGDAASGEDANAPEVGPAASRDEDGMTIPERAEANSPAGVGLPAPESGQTLAPCQGELDLPSLPGEARIGEVEAGPAEAPAPEDGLSGDKPADGSPPDDGTEPQSPPGEAPWTEDEDAAVPGAGRASDWA